MASVNNPSSDEERRRLERRAAQGDQRARMELEREIQRGAPLNRHAALTPEEAEAHAAVDATFGALDREVAAISNRVRVTHTEEAICLAAFTEKNRELVNSEDRWFAPTMKTGAQIAGVDVTLQGRTFQIMRRPGYVNMTAGLGLTVVNVAYHSDAQAALARSVVLGLARKLYDYTPPDVSLTLEAKCANCGRELRRARRSGDRFDIYCAGCHRAHREDEPRFGSRRSNPQDEDVATWTRQLLTGDSSVLPKLIRAVGNMPVADQDNLARTCAEKMPVASLQVLWEASKLAYEESYVWGRKASTALDAAKKAAPPKPDGSWSGGHPYDFGASREASALLQEWGRLRKVELQWSSFATRLNDAWAVALDRTPEFADRPGHEPTTYDAFRAALSRPRKENAGMDERRRRAERRDPEDMTALDRARMKADRARRGRREPNWIPALRLADRAFAMTLINEANAAEQDQRLAERVARELERRKLLPLGVTAAGVTFFWQWAGYAQGHRFGNAINLARVEAYAEGRDWTFEWDYDGDPDTSWMPEDLLERHRDGTAPILELLLRNEDREVIGSLGGVSILTGTREERRDAENFQRVCQAEVALEAVPDMAAFDPRLDSSGFPAGRRREH